MDPIALAEPSSGKGKGVWALASGLAREIVQLPPPHLIYARQVRICPHYLNIFAQQLQRGDSDQKHEEHF